MFPLCMIGRNMKKIDHLLQKRTVQKKSINLNVPYAPVLHKPMLFIDIGTTFGWCLMDTEGKITSGFCTMKVNRQVDPLRQKVLIFFNWLKLMHLEHDFSHLHVEHPSGYRSSTTAHFFGSLHGIITLFGYERGIILEYYHQNTLKVMTHGSIRAKKDDMVLYVEGLGFKVKDHNESDAICIMICMMAKRATLENMELSDDFLF